MRAARLICRSSSVIGRWQKAQWHDQTLPAERGSGDDGHPRLVSVALNNLKPDYR